MNQNKNHNTIYFLTTLSVYIGLVIVGSSPQLLAQTEIVNNSQSQIFEFNPKTSNAFSKLKFKSKFNSKNALPFVFVGNRVFVGSNWNSQKIFSKASINFTEIFVDNDQVLVKTRLPRASINSLINSEKLAS